MINFVYFLDMWSAIASAPSFEELTC